MDIRCRLTTLDDFPRGWLNHQYKCDYHLKFKHNCIQKAEMHGSSEVVMVVDGVKDLHHVYSLVRADIHDYRTRGVKAQIFFKLLT